MNLTWLIAIIIIVLLLYIIVVYNSLIKLKNRTEEALSDIDVQLKRRHDLIPNLVEVVKQYAKYEQSTLEKVIQARNQAMNATTMQDKSQAENMLTNTLKSLFALSENYPDLKANQNFLQLQDELSDTENKIQAARRFYNTNVRDFNTKVQTFPTNIFAKILNFKPYEFFEIEEEERQNVQIKF